MTSAATLSPFIVINLSSAKLDHSSPSPTANLSFHHNRHTNHNKTLSELSICHAQLNYGSAGEDPDEIGEAFFDEGVDGGAIMADISDDEDDMDSSVDLLIRFLQATFKKVSKRAKKASRSILPAAISPKLVSFAVDGILLLASLSILKALLEVVCSIGGTVFVLILLLRFIWAAISYFQSSGNSFNQGGSSFAAT
ncbi:protein SHORT HYPOCOTYL IN WHITE LIGHT 1 [Citrus sinensis]|uniref:protein SHORT HYPOCOTYL IN WHITE LIGHT 1 isoform X1 n=1 Tax=Citrus sinensis TaxID=2711 RepID=UPI0003D70DE9|nr:protein SHORT HYPOCOTYL IN WHITE LIGHT 1 isoform X1 [Citrus sinensis]KAH9709268.1 protein SHORT HYPOCOTYL IN WHITE LIGHT 1 [Citrus sinensis]